MLRNKISTILAVTMLIAISSNALSGKPLKVYILAGQSNMQGKAQPKTLPRMALSPESKALHDKILDASGEPRTHEDVSIVYFTGGDEKRGEERPLIVEKGLLAAGTTELIGPELGFGITVDEAVDGPILIIKTAWGGKSLLRDFRPPSADRLPFEPPQPGRRNRQMPSEEELQEMEAEFVSSQGAYYRLMMELIQKVLADPGQYSEAYNPDEGFEIAGFAWFQGYNDQFFHPYDYYTDLLAHFIRDVRKDLQVPNLLFAIGVIGINGEDVNPKILELREAMAAPAAMPEFLGSVAAVETAGFWDKEVESALEKVEEAQKLWDSSDYWTVVGTPASEDRIWNYISFYLDPEEQYRNPNPEAFGGDRTFTSWTPESLTGWLDPDFDTCNWQKGNAPIGKGGEPDEFKNEKQEKAFEEREPMVRSPWGEGNMLLMKTSFDLERSDITNFRLCLQSTGSFHAYLNGHMIEDYPWWQSEEIRRFDMDGQHVKQGVNELAFYGNILERKNRSSNAVDLYLEGLSEDKAEELRKQQGEIATPRDYALFEGKSNQPYHYLGSAYTYSLIGEALAEAVIKLEKSASR